MLASPRKEKIPATLKLYLAKSAFLSNRIIAFYQSEPAGVINTMHLSEILRI
jgi:hypothetical protein